DARLAQESRQLIERRLCVVHALDRDYATDLDIECRTHLTHAAPADQRAELVTVAGDQRSRGTAPARLGDRGDPRAPRLRGRVGANLVGRGVEDSDHRGLRVQWRCRGAAI